MSDEENYKIRVDELLTDVCKNELEDFYEKEIGMITDEEIISFLTEE
jgi:hypothetical protein